MATFGDVKGHNASLIRKVLEMSIFIKLYEEGDDEITQVWDGTGLVVPPGYTSVGMVTKADGASWTREQSTSDTESMGYSEPTRRDITSDVNGLAFTMQESKRQTLELHHGVDLAGVTVDANGNFYFDKPSRPSVRRYRVLGLGKEGDGNEAIYIARWLPYAQVTENGEQAWVEETEIQYPATLTGFTDPVFQTSFREIWGGPGVDHEAMGFPVPAGG